MSVQAPHVLIVLDGLGDLPHPALGEKTPLEAARTPHLDRLAGEGTTGTLIPVRKGVAPESDAGVMALLGYDPEQESPGRGVLEAMGAGVQLRPEDVALRLNFATANGAGLIVDQRVGRGLGTSESSELAHSLSEADLVHDLQIRATFLATVGHRGVLHLAPFEGGRLSGQITNSDPYYERVGNAGHAVKPERPYPKEVHAQVPSPEALRTAEAINRLTARAASLLESHPINRKRAAEGKLVANRVLLRDAGTLHSGLPSFQARHGLPGAAVTEMPVERGIAGLLGLADVFVGPMGADIPAALRSRAETVAKSARSHPFVYVHLKGPDEPGHDGDAPRKQKIIEQLDEHFLGPFLAGLGGKEVRIAVTADHSTPCILRGHSDDPVPLLLWGGPWSHPGGRPVKFSESSCAQGTIHEILGRELIPLFLKGPAPR